MVIDVRLRPADPLRIEVPATADRLAQIRRSLVGWMEPIGVPDDVGADIVLAVNEAATNCVEHAYQNCPDGVMVVEATVKDGRIVVCISDQGQWRTPSTEPTTRGRGLPIIRAVGDGVEVRRSTSGTTVRIDFDVNAGDRGQELGSRTT
ncbi:anti-sigma regulatory factor [Mycolicibacterium novocastrense]|uniref:ATP-binding protein n=1 Tax=Mycolicibacterium novocastrense TaxID=59813 RepID=A0AAW5SR47_MYCNV|nr:anti-sigma regulatory factor [Mycolicibacterium novocastrense]KUH66604.1 anti-sigma regulatory factor [Mycolicibacterium novocastrense]KUH73948.1 anti-sigma regulatory factor [Mycolicibacterium novocastrense]MCV7026057.1 ATP-binding protein [Mycolicibacterium novocastrense]